MRGGLAKTWAMAEAKRARTAETPKLPSFYLRLRAPYFYPTATRAFAQTTTVIELRFPTRNRPKVRPIRIRN